MSKTFFWISATALLITIFAVTVVLLKLRSIGIPPQIPDAFQLKQQITWKTYTNNEFGYTLQYPSTWTITTEHGENPETAFAPAFNNRCHYEQGDTCTNIDIYVSEGEYQEGKSLEYYFENDPPSYERNMTILAGEEAIALNYPTRFIAIKTIHNNKIYYISYGEQSKNQSTEWKYKYIFDQILSTFKFLN